MSMQSLSRDETARLIAIERNKLPECAPGVPAKLAKEVRRLVLEQIIGETRFSDQIAQSTAGEKQRIVEERDHWRVAHSEWRKVIEARCIAAADCARKKTAAN